MQIPLLSFQPRAIDGSPKNLRDRNATMRALDQRHFLRPVQGNIFYILGQGKSRIVGDRPPPSPPQREAIRTRTSTVHPRVRRSTQSGLLFPGRQRARDQTSAIPAHPTQLTGVWRTGVIRNYREEILPPPPSRLQKSRDSGLGARSMNLISENPPFHLLEGGRGGHAPLAAPLQPKNNDDDVFIHTQNKD